MSENKMELITQAISAGITKENAFLWVSQRVIIEKVNGELKIDMP